MKMIMEYDGVIQPWYPSQKRPFFYKHMAWRYSARLTDLAYSGQFKGKTWLPYTRIVQYMDLIDKW